MEIMKQSYLRRQTKSNKKGKSALEMLCFISSLSLSLNIFKAERAKEKT